MLWHYNKILVSEAIELRGNYWVNFGAVLPFRSQLNGVVEVDQAFIGGVNNKEIIVVAAEKRGSATGRIRLKHVQQETAEQLQGFIITDFHS